MDTSIPVLENPHDIFRLWFNEAKEMGIRYPNWVALATVRPDGMPDNRVVLMKNHDDRGFVFYTNFQGAKGRQLLAHPKAAMCFWWEPVQKQIRIRGSVVEVTPEEADAYFASRPRLSQVGAWASDQSTPISGRAELIRKTEEIENRFKNGPVPRPPHWSGFRLIPDEIEFWREVEFRLHDRLLYSRTPEGNWQTQWLSP